MSKRTRDQVAHLRAEVVGMFESGAPPTAIADELQISETYIHYILRSEGYPNHTAPGKLAKMTGEEKATIVREVLVEHLPLNEVATRHHLAGNTVYKLLRQAGINGIRGLIERGNKKRDSLAVQMYKDGEKLRIIQAETGVLQTRLYLLLTLQKVPLRTEIKEFFEDETHEDDDIPPEQVIYNPVP